MADYAIVKSSTLHGIADAIIAKGGSAGSLLPSAMPDAIAAIQTTATATTVEVPEKHVNFYDYDGKRLYSYTWEEARSLNDLPPLPTRDGMVCTGWNWSITDLENMVSYLFQDDGRNREGIVDIGALYKPASGATELRVGFDDGDEHEFIFTFTPSSGASVTVRMGDESSSGTGDGTLIEWKRRFTAGAGEWKTISITVTNGTCVFNGVDSPKDLREIRFGDNMTGLGAGALRDCTRLEYASFSPLTSVDAGGYQLCNTGLVCVILPDGLSSLPDQFLSLNPRLRVLSMERSHQGRVSMCQFTDPGHISFSKHLESAVFASREFEFSFVTVIDMPETITVGERSFQHCSRLVKIRSPRIVLTESSTATFLGCSRLRELAPLTVMSKIGDMVFAGCRSLESVKLTTVYDRFYFSGRGIFDGCTNLKSIDLTEFPSGIVASVNAEAFSITNGDLDERFSPDTEVFPGPYVLQGTLPPTITIYVRASDLGLWNADSEWAAHVASGQVVFEGV